MKLNELQMTSDLAVDDYITKFNVLLSELRWHQQSEGAVSAFKAGLRTWLVNKIMDRDLAPNDNDLAGWQAAAQIVATKNMRKRQLGGRYAKGNLTVRENLFNEFMQQRGCGKKANGRWDRDPDTMDVDTIETNIVKRPGFGNLSVEE
jgi:hypothetical protein